jgi:hypothetical protein
MVLSTLSLNQRFKAAFLDHLTAAGNFVTLFAQENKKFRKMTTTPAPHARGGGIWH